MYFQHSTPVWETFPGLSALVISIADADRANAELTEPMIAPLLDQVRDKQAASDEADQPSIKAWRRAYSTMGLKPTQYRCAVEALLRRFRKDGTMPQLHPLVNLLNAQSMAAGLPIAVFDMHHITDGIEVRPARGDESFTTFSGESEQPAEGEIVFADGANVAHARRWVYRQAATSSVSNATHQALIVIEGLHDGVSDDLRQLQSALPAVLERAGVTVGTAKLLSAADRTFNFDLAT